MISCYPKNQKMITFAKKNTYLRHNDFILQNLL